MPEDTYEWNNPVEWLNDKITEHASNSSNNVNELACLARSMLTTMDYDSIQDTFQDDMAADGYFEPKTSAS